MEAHNNTLLKSLLKEHWGFDDFRPFQESIMQSVMDGKDTLAILPTGGGKSLCYQLPALASDGLCLVISPLIALMEDQVANLAERGIGAISLTAGSSWKTNSRKLLAAVKSETKLLYVSPERLQTRLFLEALPHLPLSIIAIDEAHCISQWGHDFRPEYLKIAELREVHRRVPIIALTASATPTVQQDIVKQLQLRTPTVIKQSLRRSNLYYTIQYSENRQATVAAALPNQQEDGAAIIYCSSRRHTEEVARHLLSSGTNAIAYHAGLGREKRSLAQAEWMSGKTPTIVATTAFGMGIDKANVRAVIHYEPSFDLESYYQETGRAGRDGKPANVTAIFNNADIKKLRSQVDDRYPKEAYLIAIYQAVCEYLQIAIGVEPQRYFPFDLAEFAKRFGFKALQANYALRILAQEGLWTMTDAFYRPPTVCFLVGREELESISQRYPVLGNVILGLLRLYSGIIHFPAKIRLLGLAKQCKLKMAHVEALLQQLYGMGIIAYEQVGEGSQLHFHHLRVAAKHLILDRNRIKKLRDSYIFRTEALINYLENTSTCRVKMLLQYFEEAVEEDCGNCDVCLAKTQQYASPKELRLAILENLKMENKTLQNLLLQFPNNAPGQIGELVRLLMDEGKLKVLPNRDLALC